MNVTYQRELNEAYMILEGEEECEEYALRILQENHLKGIMPLTIREMDGKRDYWFAISDGKPLDRILEKRSLEYEEICQLIRSICRTLEQIEEYLLNPEHLILDPAFLYLGTRSLPRGQGHAYHETDFHQVMVCCHPSWTKDFYEQMRILMQYFINKMDHRDAHGVEAAYQMFHVTEKEYFRMEELLQIMDRSQRPEDAQEIEDGKTPEADRRMEQPEGKEDRKRGRSGPKEKSQGPATTRKLPALLAILLQAAGILLLALMVWICYRTKWIDIRLVAGAVVCLGLGLLLRRMTGKETDSDGTVPLDQHITDTYVSYSKDEYSHPGSPRGGGTELLTGSFPGRSLPLLVSENLIDQENIPLGTMPFSLGSGEDAQGRLKWSTVSREHAIVDHQEGQYCLKDCHSTNGTFLNGQKLEPDRWYPLRFGDEIFLADRGFIFRSGR